MNFQVAHRVQTSIVNRYEKRFLLWVCARLPSWVTPDHATAFGIGGAVVAFVGYAASGAAPGFLFLASLGLILNWLGDSLDGTLARARGWQRPRYGYFLDHSVDALCNLLIMGGLGLVPYVRMDAALAALLGYYLLCMYVFLNNQVTGVFELTFAAFGPTELKIGLIGLNVWMYAKGALAWPIGGTMVSAYDLLLLATALIFLAIFLQRTVLGVIALYRQEPGGPADARQRSETKASTVAK